jgi:hypothetical protein
VRQGYYFESVISSFAYCFSVRNLLYYLHITPASGHNRFRKASVTKTVTSIIQEVISGKKYFSVEVVKKSAGKIQRGIKPLTINQYLYNMKKAGDLYDAGKGWYSSIPEAFHSSIKSLDKLDSMIHKQYPLLSFSLWSTEQLQPFAHHLMSQFTHFVFVEVDAISSISDYLREQGYQTYANPQKLEVEKYFHASPKTVVIRPSITREPVEGHFAKVEKILIDLFIERDRLFLMDEAEYERVFRNLVLSNRINMARLLGYAERRKIEDSLRKNILNMEKDIFIL